MSFLERKQDTHNNIHCYIKFYLLAHWVIKIDMELEMYSIFNNLLIFTLVNDLELGLTNKLFRPDEIGESIFFKYTTWNS